MHVPTANKSIPSRLVGRSLDVAQVGDGDRMHVILNILVRSPNYNVKLKVTGSNTYNVTKIRTSVGTFRC